MDSKYYDIVLDLAPQHSNSKKKVLDTTPQQKERSFMIDKATLPLGIKLGEDITNLISDFAAPISFSGDELGRSSRRREYYCWIGWRSICPLVVVTLGLVIHFMQIDSQIGDDYACGVLRGFICLLLSIFYTTRIFNFFYINRTCCDEPCSTFEHAWQACIGYFGCIGICIGGCVYVTVVVIVFLLLMGIWLVLIAVLMVGYFLLPVSHSFLYIFIIVLFLVDVIYRGCVGHQNQSVVFLSDTNSFKITSQPLFPRTKMSKTDEYHLGRIRKLEMCANNIHRPFEYAHLEWQLDEDKPRIEWCCLGYSTFGFDSVDFVIENDILKQLKTLDWNDSGLNMDDLPNAENINFTNTSLITADVLL